MTHSTISNSLSWVQYQSLDTTKAISMSPRAAESICGKSATCKHIVAIAEADCIIGVLLSSILPTERGTGKEESLDVD